MSESVTSLRLKVDSTDIVKAEKDLNNLTKASGNTEKSAGMLSRSFASLSTILGTVGVAALTHEFVKIADEMKLLDARLKMVSASTEEYASQKKELLAISKETYSSISEITTLYTKLDPALKSLGATTKDVNNITESFAKGLKLGGANATEAASATLQFAQAMGSGVLRGEEFNAIAEASPKLMKYLAEGLGVPQTALRKMAMEGELSAGRVSAALLKMTTQINEDFTQIPMTVGMATTNLKTDLMTSIEQFDKTTGATKALAETIAGFSVDLTQYGTDITTFFVSTSKFIKDHNDALKVTASLIGGVATAYYGFIAGGAIVTGLRNITTAVYALRTAMIALQASSPILLAISVALGVATAAYLAHDDALEKKNYSTINSMDALTKAHDDLLKKRKEITSDKFALDKTQKKETAIVDGELKKIEDRLNAIGTARSNNVAKAKKESEELIKSAKTLEENAKKLAPPANVKKEKKEEKTDEQKAAEQLIKDIAKAKKDAAEYNAEVAKDLAVKNYEDELQLVKDVQKAKDDAMSDNAIRFAQMLEEMKTPLEKLNESVLNDYNFALAMFPDDIPQAWFDNVNNRFKDLKENVSEMDFSASIEFDPAGLEGTAKAIAGIGKSMSQLGKAEAQYQKNKLKTGETAESIAKNEEEHTKDQIYGYGNMAGAMSAMFKQGSDEAKAFQLIESGLTIVAGARAVLTAGTGDPYTAIPRMIAMAAMVMQTLQSAGISGGGISIASAPANSGTVLGDAMAVSESTTNIVNLLEDIHVSEYAELRDINRAVTSMAQGIESAITNIFRGDMLDTSGVNLSSSSYKAGNIETLLLTGGIGLIADKLTGGFVSGLLTSVLGALGLGGSSKQYIAGKGFNVAGGTLGSKAAGNVGASTFVDIETASKDFWGSASYSHNIITTALDEASTQSISLIYKSFSDTMMAINEGLGSNLAPAITNYTMDAIKLNLMGKTGEESVKALNDAFSSLGDKMASDVFGEILNQYQKLGEGLLETAVRVITEKAVVIQDLGDIGKTVNGDILGISQSLVTLSGSLGDFQDNIASYYDKYFTDEEKVARSQTKFLELFTDLGYELPTTTEAFRGIVDALDLSTTIGQETFTTLMSVSGAFYNFSESAKDLATDTDKLKTSLFDNIKSFIDSLSGDLSTKDPSASFYTFTSSFNTMIDAINSGSDSLLDVGNTALENAQSYLQTVTATATAGRDIQFAKAVLLNKFSGVVATPDTSLNTINSTLLSNNAVLVQELQALKFELNSIKELTITSAATQLNTLSTQRSILGSVAV